MSQQIQDNVQKLTGQFNLRSTQFRDQISLMVGPGKDCRRLSGFTGGIWI